MNLRISKVWLDEIANLASSPLPVAVAAVVTGQEMEELLGVSMGYHNRRDLSVLVTYDKILEMAKVKHSPTVANTLANQATYELLVTLESKLESIYKLRLHYTTHFLEVQDEYIYVHEFPLPEKSHRFVSCPLCTTIRRDHATNSSESTEPTIGLDQNYN